MSKDNFDEKLEEILREYVQNVDYSTNEKVKFSDNYKKNKKEVIKNGRMTENKTSRDGNTYGFSVVHFAKVAVVIILGVLAFITTVTPSIKAWRTEDANVYEGKNGKYVWILPNDITDVLENYEEVDLSFFEYLPDGFECTETAVSKKFLFMNLNKNTEHFAFKIGLERNNAVDIENAEMEKLEINGMTYWFNQKNEINTFVWYVDSNVYILYGNVEKTVLEKIINNINYKKIEKILENMSLF